MGTPATSGGQVWRPGDTTIHRSSAKRQNDHRHSGPKQNVDDSRKSSPEPASDTLVTVHHRVTSARRFGHRTTSASFCSHFNHRPLLCAGGAIFVSHRRFPSHNRLDLEHGLCLGNPSNWFLECVLDFWLKSRPPGRVLLLAE